MHKCLVSLSVLIACSHVAAGLGISWASEPLPKAASGVPNKYEMPFVATNRGAAFAWQGQARKRLLDLVVAQTPRHSLAERPLDFRIDSSEDRGPYTLHHASFRCNDGERRKCLWAAPKGPGPFPAMLCLHGHGGSAEMVFDPKTIYHGFGERFARGGYCVLAPSFPHRPYAASTLWDLMRCVDILSARKEVDAKRMGVMGLSMGGEWTMWVAACDERLKAVVVSGWMCTTEGVFARNNCPCWKLPGLVDLMDICEVHLLIAPRPVLFESAESDPWFPVRYTRKGFSRIRAGYRVFGAEGACAQDVFPEKHVVHGKMAYPLIDKILGGNAAVEEATTLQKVSDRSPRPPTNPEEVKARVAELSREYEPYLRSLPKPVQMRAHTPLASQWRMKYEVTEAKDGVRPEPPAWFAEDFDVSTWEQVTVPEWRYAGEKGKFRVPVSCILWYRTQFNAETAKPGNRTFLVFAGVEWEAQVWLNGKPLGSHRGYYEPFRFDVTGLLKEKNTLAVRVIAGPKFGESRDYEPLFPTVPAQQQRYVRDKAQSIRGFTNNDLFVGCGFGIHREVFLETVSEACVTEIFARGKPEEQKAALTIETDAAAARHMTLDVAFMPENFEGRSYHASVACDVPKGSGKQTAVVSMPEARLWTPATPCLYRCRAEPLRRPAAG